VRVNRQHQRQAAIGKIKSLGGKVHYGSLRVGSA
jgi:hypothetical protein